MKLKLDEDVNANLNVIIPTDDLVDLIDKVTESVLVIIVAATVAHIFKKFFETPR